MPSVCPSIPLQLTMMNARPVWTSWRGRLGPGQARAPKVVLQEAAARSTENAMANATDGVVSVSMPADPTRNWVRVWAGGGWWSKEAGAEAEAEAETTSFAVECNKGNSHDFNSSDYNIG